ncbi:hypothetical protein ZIOFF_008979 [Zingiber officinale]|uniref:Uncharacterized protein n=1 Tax=Zingiber officinale TaxID=94328 RepID=A0A8J5LVR0_ZINOF|nr:hypothetical protein ZIOFF_008979 [Zingiber officinale]
MEISTEEDAGFTLLLRAGNLVDHNMTSELSGEVTSSSGPMWLEDSKKHLNISDFLRRIQLFLGGVEDLDAADILKPDLILPVVGSLLVEQHFSHCLRAHGLRLISWSCCKVYKFTCKETHSLVSSSSSLGHTNQWEDTAVQPSGSGVRMPLLRPSDSSKIILVILYCLL